MTGTSDIEVVCHYGGMDLAQTRDYTVLAIGSILERGNEVWMRLPRMKVWPHVSYPIIEGDVVQEIRGFTNFLKLGIDATNEVSFSQRLQSIGLPIEPVRFSQPLKHEMFQDVRLFIENRLLRLPRKFMTSQLIQELKEQELVTGGTGVPKYRKPEGRHDDRAWALALLCHVAKRKLLGNMNLGIYRLGR